MSIGFSIFLVVVGAILTFAVEVRPEGFDLNMVGIILMIAGVVGLLLSLFMWSNTPWRRRRVADEGTVIEERRVHNRLPADRHESSHESSIEREPPIDRTDRLP